MFIMFEISYGVILIGIQNLMSYLDQPCSRSLQSYPTGRKASHNIGSRLSYLFGIICCIRFHICAIRIISCSNSMYITTFAQSFFFLWCMPKKSARYLKVIFIIPFLFKIKIIKQNKKTCQRWSALSVPASAKFCDHWLSFHPPFVWFRNKINNCPHFMAKYYCCHLANILFN